MRRKQMNFEINVYVQIRGCLCASFLVRRVKEGAAMDADHLLQVNY